MNLSFNLVPLGYKTSFKESFLLLFWRADAGSLYYLVMKQLCSIKTKILYILTIWIVLGIDKIKEHFKIKNILS